MPTISMWLPLTGKVTGTENRGGKVITRGDNANPIRAISLWAQWFNHLRATDPTFDSKTSTFSMQTVLEELDVGNKQAYMKITAPQEFLDWLDANHGLRAGGRSQGRRSSAVRQRILTAANEAELLEE